jgi:hypothetical protein
MQSESARASSAAEARFRIDHGNALPRTVKIVALDAPSREVVERLARRSWNGARFLTASSAMTTRGEGQPAAAISLRDLAGRAQPLPAEMDGTDVMVMIASAGEPVPAAAIIGEACGRRGVTTTALVLRNARAGDVALSRTLQQLRPWALMIVVAEEEDYIADILTALRA